MHTHTQNDYHNINACAEGSLIVNKSRWKTKAENGKRKWLSQQTIGEEEYPTLYTALQMYSIMYRTQSSFESIYHSN